MSKPPQRPITTIVVLIILACIMFGISFFVGLTMMEKPISSSANFSDQFTLEVLANKTFRHPIQKESALTIYASANNTFETNLLCNGSLAAAPINKTNVRNTYKLFDTGDYAVTFRNTSPTKIELTYTITFVETEYETEWVHLWLRWPIFALGVLFMLLTIPVYFLSPHLERYFGRYVKNKHVKTAIIIIAGILILFNYQVTGLFLRTSTPWIIAQGTSMEPNLHAGDLVIIEGVQAKTLQPGDIILFNKFAINTTTGLSRTLPNAVLHRVNDTLPVNGRWYFATKGDNNPTPDESLVPEDGILGKAIYVIPDLGLIVAFLTRIETKIILLAMLVVAYFVVPELKSELKKRSLHKQNAS